MKLYIIITGAIDTVGGGELYVLKKTRYLEEHGWDTMIFSTGSGDAGIPGFAKHEKYVMDHLVFSPRMSFSEKKRNELVEQMAALALEHGTPETCIVETSIVGYAAWGELLAERLSAKHVIFTYEEHVEKTDATAAEFFRFKFDRGELAAIVKPVVHRLLGDRDDVDDSDIHIFKAFEEVQIEDVRNPIIDSIDKGDCCLLVMGRLEKDYVGVGIEAAVEFAKAHADKNITLLVVGGATHTPYDLIPILSAKADGTPNLKIEFTGALFPIPKKLFEVADAAVAGAACASVCASNGVPTICVDAVDSMGIGVLGYTTTHNIRRDGEPAVPVSEILEKIIIEHDIGSQEEFDKWHTKRSAAFEGDMFSPHLDYIASGSKEKQYYDVMSVRLTRREKLGALSVRLLGSKHARKLARRMREMKLKF